METVCSSALRRREAMLLPLHTSLSGELHSCGEPLALVGPESEAGTMPGNAGWYRCDCRPEPFDDRPLERPMELGGGAPPRLHCDNDCAMDGWRPSDGGSCSWETPAIPAAAQRPSLAWKEHNPSPIAAAGNCGRLCVGNSVPGARNTFVVFLRFFHLARRFWNQTCTGKPKTMNIADLQYRKNTLY